MATNKSMQLTTLRAAAACCTSGKVTDVADASCSNFSENFGIDVDKCEFTVTAPTGDPPPWYEGATEHIQWSSTGSSGNVKLELYRNGSFLCVIDEPLTT